ncbi:heme-binding protein [Granulicella sp. WH15]|uniref:GlcG/HbpS family heme-binding protein n=1 Tax=Granulicella sp. WH15 TaxID=2602070 RepID=UPI001366BBE3|nr:heme-binding protein [Granulicella sp. WH15]QHN02933.1 heme-binding protein [Granulicella sp. WH15]
MKNLNLTYVASALVFFAGAIDCKAQTLVTQKALSVDAALAVAHGALDKCHTDGYRVSLTVLDNSGLVKLQVRGDGTGPHTLEHSRRKAYTALTFKRTSGETARAWAAATTPPPAIEGTVGAQGGVPIKAGNEVIGSIGVSGAPGGEKDEACAVAGIAKIADLLK